MLAVFIPFVRVVLAAELFLYISILILAGLQRALQQRQAYLSVGLPLAISVMHLSWGSGFLWSILSSSVQKHG
jgi:hypothetical protein